MVWCVLDVSGRHVEEGSGFEDFLLKKKVKTDVFV